MDLAVIQLVYKRMLFERVQRQPDITETLLNITLEALISCAPRSASKLLSIVRAYDVYFLF